jgi:DNA-binding transcriptional regulator YiaG
MATRLGTRQQTISEWEKGMYQPRGASVTLLSIVADSAGFQWDTEEKPVK